MKFDDTQGKTVYRSLLRSIEVYRSRGIQISLLSSLGSLCSLGYFNKILLNELKELDSRLHGNDRN
jgi:hypothetical protein